MASSLKKLPPEVARELLRHVKPRVKVNSAKAEAKNSSNTRLLVGCATFVGCAASLPYFATQSIGNLTDRDEALTAAQVRRGAFLNSGSRDAGKDTNWDWKNGQYIYSKGFAEHLKKQHPDETDLGPDIGPMVQEEKQKRQ
eukprot:CAMPEP_0116998936 /NCGR_PEP_ID=MMETSP0472-20121206/1839_1 /TAXON_ID=693140 ORGANISM="Tiarina fusus, Strain LIS" /NCGR_SAMPLE_ID=MMETSP0472 /ASSEMBLY_ACC=CAM_ASM_000603 /LENGTH=140 /DNA_ID=CAMNT_0004698249 /DNA_START=106 /DNA_END=528 /DNA_ORIENTATION=-